MRYEIKELSLGGVLDQAVAIVKNHLGSLLAIGAILMLPTLLPTTLLQANAEAKLGPATNLEQMIQNQAIAQAELAKYGPLLIILSLASMVLMTVANAALVTGVASAYLGKSVSVGQTIASAFGRFFPLIWTWILVGIVVGIGFLLLIIPGILFALWYSLATQVVVIEKINGFAAMKRSKAVIKGHIGQYFVLMFLLAIIGFLLGAGAGLIPQPHLKAIATCVIQVVATIISSAAIVVFYFSCRCANENYDLQLLAREVSSSVEEMPELEEA